MNALEAATAYGGFNLDFAREEKMTATDIYSYFSKENFKGMFGAHEEHEEEGYFCDVYSLDDCADAVIRKLDL